MSTTSVTTSDTHRAINAVWRIESARLIAGLARIVRDVGLAEELAQDALVAALEQWPESGVPDKPGAWLMATAKHRAIDRLRRDERLERKQEELAREPHHRGDRTSLSRAGVDHRAAHRSREAHPHGGACPVRRARGTRARHAAVVGAAGHLPHLQRGLLGDGG